MDRFSAEQRGLLLLHASGNTFIRWVWPAVWAETRRVLGEGDWQPTIRRVVVTELLG
jgi:hypothetical protein